LFFFIERFIFNSSASVILESKTEYDFGISKGLFNDGKAKIVSMSIDICRFVDIKEEEVKKLKRIFCIPPNAFVIGMLGRIAFQKDPETFVKAAKILNSQIDNIYFLWVGDGDLKEKVLYMAKSLGLMNKMIVTGQQSSGDIPKLLSVIDVLLFTSRFEGLPTALLEAMAAKKIIVAAHVGSIQDIIRDGETGWLFDAGDYQKAAMIIKNIYENRKMLAKVGTTAFNLIVDKYSPKEYMAFQFQRVYEDLLRCNS
jgi:glycosyltransferase involved in cell wall biosynthesis